MPAWYDILSFDVDRELDEEQLMASAAAVHALIDREIERGVESHRIILAGFSQGGAVVYQAALSYPEPLAGILALSTYFATADKVKINPVNRQIPILICHGSQDPVVPEVLGQRSQGALQSLGFNPAYLSYPMEHAVCLEEIAAISDWLNSTLSS